MNRYRWNGETRYLYPDSEFKGEKIFVPRDECNPIFVNILERKTDDSGMTRMKVKLFYADGTILEGWTLYHNDPIDITNKYELFDGRFNA